MKLKEILVWLTLFLSIATNPSYGFRETSKSRRKLDFASWYFPSFRQLSSYARWAQMFDRKMLLSRSASQLSVQQDSDTFNPILLSHDNTHCESRDGSTDVVAHLLDDNTVTHWISSRATDATEDIQLDTPDHPTLNETITIDTNTTLPDVTPGDILMGDNNGTTVVIPPPPVTLDPSNNTTDSSNSTIGNDGDNNNNNNTDINNNNGTNTNNETNVENPSATDEDDYIILDPHDVRFNDPNPDGLVTTLSTGNFSFHTKLNAWFVLYDLPSADGTSSPSVLLQMALFKTMARAFKHKVNFARVNCRRSASLCSAFLPSPRDDLSLFSESGNNGENSMGSAAPGKPLLRLYVDGDYLFTYHHAYDYDVMYAWLNERSRDDMTLVTPSDFLARYPHQNANFLFVFDPTQSSAVDRKVIRAWQRLIRQSFHSDSASFYYGNDPAILQTCLDQQLDSSIRQTLATQLGIVEGDASKIVLSTPALIYMEYDGRMEVFDGSDDDHNSNRSSHPLRASLLDLIAVQDWIYERLHPVVPRIRMNHIDDVFVSEQPTVAQLLVLAVIDLADAHSMETLATFKSIAIKYHATVDDVTAAIPLVSGAQAPLSIDNSSNSSTAVTAAVATGFTRTSSGVVFAWINGKESRYALQRTFDVGMNDMPIVLVVDKERHVFYMSNVEKERVAFHEKKIFDFTRQALWQSDQLTARPLNPHHGVDFWQMILDHPWIFGVFATAFCLIVCCGCAAMVHDLRGSPSPTATPLSEKGRVPSVDSIALSMRRNNSSTLSSFSGVESEGSAGPSMFIREPQAEAAPKPDKRKGTDGDRSETNWSVHPRPAFARGSDSEEDDGGGGGRRSSGSRNSGRRGVTWPDGFNGGVPVDDNLHAAKPRVLLRRTSFKTMSADQRV